MGATPLGFVPHATVYKTAGAPLILEFTIVDETDAAVPLTLSDARWQVVESGTALVSKTLGSGIEVTDGANGILRVTISTGDDSDLSGLYEDELELTHIDGRVESGAAFGLVNIRSSILA